MDTLPHRIYTLSSGFTTSAREQLQTLYRIRPEAEDVLKINPADLEDKPNMTSSYNANLLTKDTGWTPGYSFEEALEDYFEWLQHHEN